MGDKYKTVWHAPEIRSVKDILLEEKAKKMGVTRQQFYMFSKKNPGRQVVGTASFVPRYFSGPAEGGRTKVRFPKEAGSRRQAIQDIRAATGRSPRPRAPSVQIGRVEVLDVSPERAQRSTVGLRKEEFQAMKQALKEKFPEANVARRRRVVAVRNPKTGLKRMAFRENVISLRNNPVLRSVKNMGKLGSRVLGVPGKILNAVSTIEAAKRATEQNVPFREGLTDFTMDMIGLEDIARQRRTARYLKNRT